MKTVLDPIRPNAVSRRRSSMRSSGRVSLLSATLISVSLLIGCSKIVVVKLPDNSSAPANGVVYALPNTVVRVNLKVDKTIRASAPFAAYASIFAPDLAPVCEDAQCSTHGKVQFSVEKDVRFSTFGEPDPDNVFLVKFSGSGAIDQNLAMTWDEAGLLTSASAAVTNRTTDIITSSIGVATGIASKTAFGAARPNDAHAPTSCADAVPGSETNPASDAWFLPRLFNNLSSEPLIDNYCAIQIAERTRLPQDDTLLRNALVAYGNRIAPLLQEDADLLQGGTTVFDKVSQMHRVETEINARLIPLFIGHKTLTTWNASFDVRKVVEGTSLALFKLDPTKCVALNPNIDIPPDGEPMPADFPPVCPSATKAVTLTISYYPGRNDQLFSELTDVTTGDRSFRYRIPAQVKAIVGDGSKQLGGGVFYVAQLGTVISLPANRRSKSLAYRLDLIEATGGLRSFSLGSTGSVDSSTVNSLGSSTDTILNAKRAADAGGAATAASAAAARSTAAVLTRQKNLLDLQDEICTIQAKYNLPCTVQPRK